jgi:hypothetical protein
VMGNGCSITCGCASLRPNLDLDPHLVRASSVQSM